MSRLELVRRGLAPETQCWLTSADGSALRVDFLWWRERTVGEADGLGKYAKYGPSSELDPLQKEKLRQELLEEWGFEVVRWNWHQMRRDPDAVAARVRRGFARSVLRQEIRAQRRARARTPPCGRAVGSAVDRLTPTLAGRFAPRRAAARRRGRPGSAAQGAEVLERGAPAGAAR